eukprot:scaffold78744_cov23-Cyclotella_meneghiniana.AAC.3
MESAQMLEYHFWGHTNYYSRGLELYFWQHISCNYVPAVVLSDTELTCVSPIIDDVGAVQFTVSTNGVGSFMYLPKILTTSIEPTMCSFVSGTL